MVTRKPASENELLADFARIVGERRYVWVRAIDATTVAIGPNEFVRQRMMAFERRGWLTAVESKRDLTRYERAAWIEPKVSA